MIFIVRLRTANFESAISLRCRASTNIEIGICGTIVRRMIHFFLQLFIENCMRLFMVDKVDLYCWTCPQPREMLVTTVLQDQLVNGNFHENRSSLRFFKVVSMFFDDFNLPRLISLLKLCSTNLPSHFFTDLIQDSIQIYQVIFLHCLIDKFIRP